MPLEPFPPSPAGPTPAESLLRLIRGAETAALVAGRVIPALDVAAARHVVEHVPMQCVAALSVALNTGDRRHQLFAGAVGLPLWPPWTMPEGDDPTDADELACARLRSLATVLGVEACPWPYDVQRSVSACAAAIQPWPASVPYPRAVRLASCCWSVLTERPRVLDDAGEPFAPDDLPDDLA